MYEEKIYYFCFFFYKQKTAYEMRISDWSSDVCSSDLAWKNTESPMTENIGRAYKIKQYFYDAERGERNTEVRSYDALATHHPKYNYNAQMVDGILRNVERPQRRYDAFIDGEYQETERSEEHTSELQSLMRISYAVF